MTKPKKTEVLYRRWVGDHKVELTCTDGRVYSLLIEGRSLETREPVTIVTQAVDPTVFSAPVTLARKV